MNLSGNSAKSKMVKQGSEVSNQISSVCLCLAECLHRMALLLCLTTCSSIYFYLHRQLDMQDVVQLSFMEVVNLIYSIYVICMFVENILIKPASFTTLNMQRECNIS